jgi:hypothetical protein
LPRATCVALKRGGDAKPQRFGKVRRQCATLALLDVGAHRVGADAEIAVHDLFRRHRDADFGQAHGIGPARDRLAVDQHAVAIEDDEFG